MKRRIIYAVFMIMIAALSILSTGCEKNGKIKIINRTSFPLYASVKDEPVVIAPGAYKKFDIKTDTQYPLFDEVGKYTKVDLRGETYQIWDGYEEKYVDFTYVWVKAGEISNIYALPNRASVKVINNTNQPIKRVVIQKNYGSGVATDANETDILSGDYWYKPIDYVTGSIDFYLIVQVVFQDNSIRTYGDSTVKKHLDEQFLIDVQPVNPER